ncbi:MAG: choloylglycine hydrolase [Clostridia bacterium]|nr:choloylglycine hydrolase [Clostridia bacterium]
MCTAATYKSKDFYFGRTLDYEFSYGDEVVVIPRNYQFDFLEMGEMNNHYAIIGMACVMENTPLFYDAVNEKGLGMAGLNFVGNACYFPHKEGKENIAQYELITWILSQCENVEQAKKLISRMNILDTPFREGLPVAKLHWIIADKDSCITVESMADGLKVYDNPVGVLTNNPPFPMQMQNLANYRHLTPNPVESTFAEGLDLPQYSRGMGAIGLPGDLSSASRFVRVAFVKMNSFSAESESESVSQFFHILNSVDQQRGCCHLGEGKYEITIYTSCCNAGKGIYYYTTYDNHQICAVDMHRENLDGTDFVRYPIIKEENIRMIN